MRWVIPDFETQSHCDLKSAGAYRYAVDPTTHILCCSFVFDDDQSILWWPGDPLPPRVLTAIERGAMFVAHNAGFERNIWTQQMVAFHGAPEIPLAQWHDSMARACQMALPASLDKLLRALDLPLEKDTEGRRLTLSFSKPDRKTGMLPALTPAAKMRIGQYCDSDTAGQAAVHRRLGWLPPHERPIWELSQRINDRGVGLDMAFVRAAQQVVDRGTAPLAAEFAALTGLKFSQTVALQKWVEDQGVHLDNLRAETIDELLGADKSDDDADDAPETAGDPAQEKAVPISTHLPPRVQRALTIRRLIGSASIKKLKAMEACVGYDGRARGLMRYHGTTPGRQTSHLFQLHNFPRGTNDLIGMDIDDKVEAIMSGDPDWVRAMTGVEPVECVVGSLRHAIQAAPGHVLMAGDFAGIQARTVLALAGQHDKTALMAAGVDIYCDMATQVFRRPITKADTAERQVGKSAALGLGFQMGWKKFHAKYLPDDADLAALAVDVYRQEWAPLVPKAWYGLQQAAVDTVWTGDEHESHGVVYRLEDAWLTAEILNGSKIWYYNPKPVTRLMPWSTQDEPDYRKGFTYQVEKMGHLITRDAFGGQLTENIVMKIEREMVEHAKAQLEANGFPVIFEVHDEIVCEPKIGADLDAFKEIMEDVPRWVRDLRIPVQVDVWQGDRYKK